jgi:hypothetical protein
MLIPVHTLDNNINSPYWCPFSTSRLQLHRSLKTNSSRAGLCNYL